MAASGGGVAYRVSLPIIGTVRRDVERDLYVVDVAVDDDAGKRHEEPVMIACGVLENVPPQQVMQTFSTAVNRSLGRLHALANRNPFVGRPVTVNGRSATVTSVDPVIAGETYVTVRDADGWRIRVLWDQCTCL